MSEPKFRAGQKVKTPHGEGTIVSKHEVSEDTNAWRFHQCTYRYYVEIGGHVSAWPLDEKDLALP